MANVQIGYINIAETGTTTAVSYATDFPVHRLFDRYISRNWKSGSVGVKSTTGSDLITNGGFTSTTANWSTDDDCTLSSVAGGESGNALTINYSYASTGSNLVTNGDFSSVTTPWAVGSSEYSASIVGSGYSGNAINIYNGTTGSNLVTNPGFESPLGAEWTASPGTIALAAAARTGSSACELTYTAPTNLVVNGTMESWASSSVINNWTNVGCTMTRVTTSYTGTYAMQIVCSPDTDYVYQDVPVTIGKTYRVEGWVRRTTSGSVKISVQTTGGSVIKEGYNQNVLSTYRKISFYFVSTVSTIRLCLGLSTATFLYDDVSVTEVNTNLVTNSDFTTTTEWTNYTAGTTITQNSTYYLSSPYSATSLGTENGIKTTVTGLSVGASYTAVAYTYNLTTTAVGIFIAGQNYIVTPTINIWNTLSVSFTATSSSHQLSILSLSNMYVDEVVVYSNDTTSKIYQLVSTTPSSDYTFSCYFNNGSLSTIGQGVSITVRRGSNIHSVWDTQSYTIGSSYALATITFTCPSDETSMYICFQRDNSSTGSVYLDDFAAYIMSTQTTQYIQQTISGLTAGKRHRVSGYVLKPTTADAGEYIVGVYRTDTSALISSITGTATLSWVAFSDLTFDLPTGLTSVYLRLIRNSDSYGDLRFDSISMYRMLYSTTQSAYQNISTTINYQYRLIAYVKDGIGSGALTTSPYEINIYNGTTLVDSDTGNTSSSWTAKTIDFYATGTTTKIELKKNSTTDGNIAFDTVTMYRVLTSYEDQWIKVDQHTSPIEIDTLVIPADHHLDGLSCQLQYSADGSTGWTDAVTDWTQSGSGLIRKTMSSAQTRNYWRMYITGSDSDWTLPQIGEFYLTNLYQLSSQPLFNLTEGYSPNVNRFENPSWKVSNTINGTYRRFLEYTLPFANSTDKTFLESLQDECFGKKPFFLIDHNGSEYFVELMEDIVFEPVTAANYKITLKMREVL